MILRFLIDKNDNLPDYIALKNVVILLTCAIKEDAKFHPQKLWKKHCIFNKHLKKVDKELMSDACQTKKKKK